ncbi:MAG TPA: phenylalanine--tRNA ligase subunit alpha [Bacillota bacterium]|nr:phenylalanine--tRNA ligase subunit alpha [Bacillota bacterium]
MKEKLQNIIKAAQNELSGASASDALEQLRVKYLGKKGELTAILRSMGAVPAEERPALGQLANEVREKIENIISEKKEQLKSKELENRLGRESIDITLPARRQPLGHLHPLTQVEYDMREIFIDMGFEVVEGPEVELTYNNFDALNAPKDHPSRDMTDTFYFNPDVLLRTQTSPVQVRAMLEKKPPLRIISPGRVYRNDEVDATHSPMFHQMEGLVVDKNVTMGDLKGVLAEFAVKMFGADTKTRFRPHNFPFTEPSAEVDISCFVCKGEGCRLCKGEGWIELLGAGLVHPNVLRGCGIDPDIYSGFAFGMGIERVAMCKYRIDDMRLLFENDIRFLSQF